MHSCLVWLDGQLLDRRAYLVTEYNWCLTIFIFSTASQSLPTGASRGRGVLQPKVGLESDTVYMSSRHVLLSVRGIVSSAVHMPYTYQNSAVKQDACRLRRLCIQWCCSSCKLVVSWSSSIHPLQTVVAAGSIHSCLCLSGVGVHTNEGRVCWLSVNMTDHRHTDPKRGIGSGDYRGYDAD